MAERVQVRSISNEEGNRLLRILRRWTGSVVTWRRAQVVLLSAQAMDVPQIARVAFTSEDRVRDVIYNFNADGFELLYPRYEGGRPPKFTDEQRDEIKRIALSRPEDHAQPFSIWSLFKLADYLVEEGVVEDISHERLRTMLREQGVSFQRIRPGRNRLTLTTRPRRSGCSTCMRWRTASANGVAVTLTRSSASTSSGPEPPATPGPPVGMPRRSRPRPSPPATSDLPPAARHSAPVRRPRPARRPPLWTRQAAQAPRRVPRFPGLCPLATPRAQAGGDHPGQLQPAPDHQDRHQGR